MITTNYTVADDRRPAITNGRTWATISGRDPVSGQQRQQHYITERSDPSPASTTPHAGGAVSVPARLDEQPAARPRAGRFPNQAYVAGGKLHAHGSSRRQPGGDHEPDAGPTRRRRHLPECRRATDIPDRFPTTTITSTPRSLRRPQRGRRDEPVSRPTRSLIRRSGRATWSGSTASRTSTGHAVEPAPQLAPVSFTNGLDGARRRRLFSLDSWDLNNFRWTNDNPAGHSRPTAGSRSTANAGFTALTTGYDKCRILGPRPRTGASTADFADAGPGPARQEDQPELPAAGLERPQRAGPAEMDQRHLSASEVGAAAQGGGHAGRAGPAQPVRDQHRRFPRHGRHDDALGEPRRADRGGSDRVEPDWRRRRSTPVLPVPPTLIMTGNALAAAAWATVVRARRRRRRCRSTSAGMEYNPVAINEVLAYSYLYSTASGDADAGQPVLHRAGEHPDVARGLGPCGAAGRVQPGARPGRVRVQHGRWPACWIRIPAAVGHRLHGRRSVQPARSVSRPAQSLRQSLCGDAAQPGELQAVHRRRR